MIGYTYRFICTLKLLVLGAFTLCPIKGNAQQYEEPAAPEGESKSAETDEGSVAQDNNAPDTINAAVQSFEKGDYANALALFEKALADNPTVAPGRIHYNRGSCLLELGQYSQAKHAFEKTAALDPDMRLLAQLRIAEIHLILDQHKEAQRLLQKTKDAAFAKPTLKTLWQTVDDELQSTRTDENADTAESDATTSSEHDTKTKQGPWSLGLFAEMGGGYDSNVSQVGLSGNAGLIDDDNSSGGGLASVSLALSLYRKLSSQSQWELRYGISQRIYPQQRFDAFSLQLQSLSTGLRYALSSTLSMHAELLGTLTFGGLRTFTAASIEGGSRLALQFLPDDHWQSDLSLSAMGVRDLNIDFAFLRGHRISVGLRQLYHWDSQGNTRASVGLGIAYHSYTQGTQSDTIDPGNTSDLVGRLCANRCTPFLSVPLAYDAPTADLHLHLRWANRIRLSSTLGLSWRFYRDTFSQGWILANESRLRTGEARRRDLRFSTNIELSVRVFAELFVDLRYDFVLNASELLNTDLGTIGTLADYDFRAHTVALFLRWQPHFGPFEI